MGEEDKKPEGKEEEKKGEEEKKPAEEGKKEEVKEKKEEKAEEKGDVAEKEKVKEKEEAAPPEEIVLRVYMHCEGCARKVRRCLKGFEGVEDVQTDCKAHKVVVKGKKADPLKVLERIQKKSHRKVELLTPIPKPPLEEKKPEEKKEEEKPKVEEKKEEPPVIVVVLKVHMHCEACAQNIEKCIMKMKGVQAAVPDYKSSQVTVKGVFEPAKLVEYVYKRAKKHAVIVKEEVEKKAEDKPKEGDEKKDGKDDSGKDAGSGEKKDGKDGGEEGKGAEDGKDDVKTELKKNDYYSTKYYTEYVYAPQIFSDENPNACSVM